MPALLPTFAHLVVGGQQAVHGAHRAQVLPLIEQRGIDLGRGGIDEAIAVQQVKNLAAFRCAQCAWR